MQVLEKFISTGWRALQELSSIQWEKWTLHIITAGTGSCCGLYGRVFAGGVVSGAAITHLIDRIYLREKYSFQEYSSGILQLQVGFSLLTGIGLAALSSYPLTMRSISVFSSLTAGLLLGIKGYEYFSNQATRKINLLFKRLKESQKYAHPPVKLELTKYSDELKYLDLKKLSKKIDEETSDWKPPTQLNLSKLDLTDDTLKQLGAAPWFKNVEEVDLSENPRLTVEGLKWLGKTGFSHLKTLNLNYMNLTDNDLKQMAESGHFSHLQRLDIAVNPQLTGKGLRWIGTGFMNLQALDISHNHQVLSKDLDAWIESDGFKHLEVLHFCDMNLTGDILGKMIDQAVWIQHLKGFNISNNSGLTQLPCNLSKLTGLEEHGISQSVLLSGGPIYYRGRGLFCISCFTRDVAHNSPEYLKLLNSGKTFCIFSQ